jgi:NAD+ synthase (glutamine-hydrolysing)
LRGFVRVSAAVPKVAVTDLDANCKQVLSLMKRADAENSVVACFPELCITSYSAKDLFHNMFFLKEAEKGLGFLVENSKGLKTVSVVGLPVEYESGVYNCAAAIQDGKLLCVVPKSYLPNYGEFEEGRWFSPAKFVKEGSTIELAGMKAPFGTDVLLTAKNIPNCTIGIEICEDMWVQASPHIYQVNAGATIVLNMSASNFTIGKEDIRESLAKSASDKGKCCYVYTAAAPGESSELAWDGHHFICENGSIIARGPRFSREPQLLTTDIDLESVVHDRITIGTFKDCADANRKEFRKVMFDAAPQDNDMELLRKINRHPFIPTDPATLATRCWEVFEIQTNSLRTRLERIGCKSIVLGISGGLDSTMAALSAVSTLDAMGIDRKNLICVTMPGFGTTSGTKYKAIALARLLGATVIEAPISDVSYAVMELIGHKAVDRSRNVQEMLENVKADPKSADATFENIQARARTFLLMSYANKNNAIVLGTSDMSEKALGWSTYAGDQISMYDINAGVPKTLIQFVIKWVANEKVEALAPNDPESLRKELFSILDTPITPELLPTSKDKVSQLSEEKVGPYELNDFFLYWNIRHGASPQKILDVAQKAFEGDYDLGTMKKWLVNFYTRFASQQFKRNASADGPKIGMVDLSPRVSWRMSTDADCKKWIEQVNAYE